MIMDGRKIADAIIQEIKGWAGEKVLHIISVDSDLAQKKYMKAKQKKAESAGIGFKTHELSTSVKTQDIKSAISEIAAREDTGGIVVQLPLPKNITSQEVLDAIPVPKDPDLLSSKSRQLFARGESRIMPPVAGAVCEILERHNVPLKSKKIVVLGEGELVGQPVITWLRNENLKPKVVSKEKGEIAELNDADIIISGAGSPGLIKPEMIKSSAVLVDAGTSEHEGGLMGDADPACVDKCSLFTPVPGGVGPVAVAKLLENLVQLQEDEH